MAAAREPDVARFVQRQILKEDRAPSLAIESETPARLRRIAIPVVERLGAGGGGGEEALMRGVGMREQGVERGERSEIALEQGAKERRRGARTDAGQFFPDLFAAGRRRSFVR